MRNPSKDFTVLAGVSACFLLSGFAALLYQTAWLRQFSIVFGTSELAVATVLAAYMAGLGAGAAVASRYVDRLTRPVLVYGVLEAGIAITALGVPALLAVAGWLHVQALGGAPEPMDSGGMSQSLYYLFVSFIILALPTGFMGATLPLLTRYAVQQDEQVGPRVAWLYGINTVGAVLGTLVAAFVLLPRIGLQGTVFVGVGVNLIVFLIAWWLAQSMAGAPKSEVKPRKSLGALGRPAWILPLIALSGSVSFLYEVLWTRLLSHVLGGTVYAFATMLASFLTGIALGGMAAGRFSKNQRDANAAFAACQLAIALASAAVYLWLQGYVPTTAGLAANSSLAALVILPSALFIGATFPLAVRVLAESADDAPHATALTYAWNTAGAIAGSILAGFFLIPMLGFSGAVKVAVGANALIAIAALSGIGRLYRVGGALAAATVVGLVFYQPGIPYGLIDTSLLDSARGGRVMHYSVGRSATVMMKDYDGFYYLRTNGLPEAFIEPQGTPPLRHSQKWLTALPVVARPDTESMLIVGFGGGVAVEGVPPTVTDVDVIELEPDVIEANRSVAELRRYDPLEDERVRIIVNDARNALALTNKQYDVVVSQPSHPWTAGASHLYTAEFMQLVRQHLADDGVLLQWINSLFVDAELLQSLSATLLENFEHVRIYQPAPTSLLFLASDGPLEPERSVAGSGRPLNEALLHYSWLGINGVEDLLVALTADTDGVARFADSAPISTDNNNRMAMFSRSDSGGLTPAKLFELFADTDPLLNPDSWVFSELGNVNLEYIGYRLLAGGMESRALRLRHEVPDASVGLTIEGLGLRHQGQLAASEDSLRAAVQADPSNMQARYALVWRFLGQLAQGTASDEIAQLAAGIQGPAKSVLDGWRLGVEGDWRGLAALDRALSRSDPTDLWYPEAVKLRADWRIQGTDDPATNRDALRLLDRAITVNPLTDLLVIRAGAALRLNDPYAFVETARQIRRQLAERLALVRQDKFVFNDRDRLTMGARIDGFIRQLDTPFVEPLKQRADAVRQEFVELKDTFDAT